MAKVSFILEAKDQGATAAFLNLSDAQRKEAMDFARMTAEAQRAQAAQAKFATQSAQALQRQAGQLTAVDRKHRELTDNAVRRTNLRYDGNLGMTQTSRQMLKQGATAGLRLDPATGKMVESATSQSMKQIQDLQSRRSAMAQQLRQERQTARKASEDAAAFTTSKANTSIVASAFNEMKRLRDKDSTDRVNKAAPGMLGEGAIDFALKGGKVDADQSKYLTKARMTLARNLRKMPEMYGKVTEEQFNKMAEEMASTMQSKAQKWGNALSLAGGGLITGATAAIGFATQGIQAHREYKNQMADKLIETEDTMRMLYSTGNNSSNRAAIRDQVLNSSIANGIGVSQMAAVRTRLDSGFSDMPEETKKVLIQSVMNMYKTGTNDIESATMGLGSAYTAFGGQMGGGPKAMQRITNLLANAADIGNMNVDEVTPYLSDVLQSFKSMGYRAEDATAAMAFGSKTGRRPEAYMTALRNMPLDIMKAQKEGKFTSTGNFMQDITALKGHSSEDLLDIFGKENQTMVKFLTDGSEALGGIVKQQEGIGADTDILADKIYKQFSDPMKNVVDQLKSLKVIEDNIKLINTNGVAQKQAVDQKMIDVGVEKNSSSYTPGMIKESRKTAAGAAMDYLGVDISGYHETGARALHEQQKKAGDHIGAGITRIAHGQYFGNEVFKTKVGSVDAVRTWRKEGIGGRRTTTKDDADQFAALMSDANMRGLSDTEFVESLNLTPKAQRQYQIMNTDLGDTFTKAKNKLTNDRADALADGKITPDEQKKIDADQQSLVTAMHKLIEAFQDDRENMKELFKGLGNGSAGRNKPKYPSATIAQTAGRP